MATTMQTSFHLGRSSIPSRKQTFSNYGISALPNQPDNATVTNPGEIISVNKTR